MKKIILVFMFMFMMISCATIEYKAENKGLFNIELVTKDGKKVDITVKAEVTVTDGVVTMEAEAYGDYQDETGRYTCTVKMNLDKKPVKNVISLEEDCELVYKKDEKKLA
ncbi:hypothetical protein OAD88_07000 [Flavobacteriaceae bacterium]|nr:hypothetical protein [Flavobacteriaceae bacterium]